MTRKELNTEELAELRASPYVASIISGRINFTPEFKREAYRQLMDGKSMRTMFTQSRVRGSTPPTEYDIVSCLTKSDPGTFEDFCSEFGYDTDSRQAEKTYKAVKREWEKVARVFGADSECLEDLCNVESGIGIRIR